MYISTIILRICSEYNNIYGIQQHNMFAFPRTTVPAVLCCVRHELPAVKQDCESVHAKARLQKPYVIYILKLTPIHTSISNGKCGKLNGEHVRAFKHNKRLAHVM